MKGRDGKRMVRVCVHAPNKFLPALCQLVQLCLGARGQHSGIDRDQFTIREPSDAHVRLDVEHRNVKVSAVVPEPRGYFDEMYEVGKRPVEFRGLVAMARAVTHFLFNFLFFNARFRRCPMPSLVVATGPLRPLTTPGSRAPS